MQPTGSVASLHVHPAEPAAQLISLQQITVETEKGICEDPRYFNRRNRTGKPGRRQVTLIEREQIAEHAAASGLESIEPGRVRSNIETLGIDLHDYMGETLQVGEALLFLYAPRTPCAQMDAICPGLKDLMKRNRQGVLAQVIRGGVIKVGDSIVPVQMPK